MGDIIDLFNRRIIPTSKGPIRTEELEEQLSDLYADFGNLFEVDNEEAFWDGLRELKRRIAQIPER